MKKKFDGYMIFAGKQPIAQGQAEFYIFRKKKTADEFISGMRRGCGLPLDDWHYKKCKIVL